MDTARPTQYEAHSPDFSLPDKVSANIILNPTTADRRMWTRPEHSGLTSPDTHTRRARS